MAPPAASRHPPHPPSDFGRTEVLRRLVNMLAQKHAAVHWTLLPSNEAFAALKLCGTHIFIWRSEIVVRDVLSKGLGSDFGSELRVTLFVRSFIPFPMCERSDRRANGRPYTKFFTKTFLRPSYRDMRPQEYNRRMMLRFG
eukprot:523743-Prorocentrum_minimum.AAC.8